MLAVLGRGTGPRGEKMAGASPGTDSQVLATILDPFRTIFVNLGPDPLSEARSETCHWLIFTMLAHLQTSGLPNLQF